MGILDRLGESFISKKVYVTMEKNGVKKRISGNEVGIRSSVNQLLKEGYRIIDNDDW